VLLVVRTWKKKALNVTGVLDGSIVLVPDYLQRNIVYSVPHHAK